MGTALGPTNVNVIMDGQEQRVIKVFDIFTRIIVILLFVLIQQSVLQNVLMETVFYPIIVFAMLDMEVSDVNTK